MGQISLRQASFEFSGRLLIFMAVLLLVISGGNFTHGNAVSDGHIHEVAFAKSTLIADHSHAGVVDAAGPHEALLHCGSEIMTSETCQLVFTPLPLGILLAGDTDYKEMMPAGADPPPPRFDIEISV